MTEIAADRTEALSRVTYRKGGHTARIILNRPAKLNAMDLRMHAELAEVWDDFERDDEMRVGVLEGAGDRAFCVGQDLGELAERIRDGKAPVTSFGSHGRPGWPRLTERFTLTKPVIAKVGGLALGGGFELALACDIIVASTDAQFALPEARLGLIAGAGGVFRLARQLPRKTAMGLLMTGRRISAERACALGLINEAVPRAELEECVLGWVEDLLRCAPLSIRAIKQVVAESEHLPLAEAFSSTYAWEEARKHSADAVEGPLAFVERRAPRWTGR